MRFLVLTSALLTVFLFTSCGDDGSPVEIGDPVIGPATPEAFMDSLASALARKDLDAYAALLHEDFVFEGLSFGEPKTPTTWDRIEELAILNNMFEGYESLDGFIVQTIDLDLVISSFEETESGVTGETWYSVEAAVDLTVFTASAGEDGFTNFIVRGDQDFVLRPNGTGGLSAGKQIDRGPFAAKGAAPSTEESSWTAVKMLFRWSVVDVDAYFSAFVTSYTQKDSAAYASLLADSYVFELLDSDPDDANPAEFWDLEEELSIAGHMFSSWETSQGAAVQTISLAINPKTIKRTSDLFGIEMGEVTLNVETRVELTVFVIDQGVDGFTNYIVFSDQDWTLHAAPGSDLAATYQVDLEPIGSSVVPRGTEETSWGDVKNLFR